MVDFKSQKQKKDKFNFYSSWGAQGAAYLAPILIELNTPTIIFKPEDCRIISVVIDSEDPDIIDEKDWDYRESLELFRGAKLWWNAEHSWQPAVKEMAG